MRPLMFSGGAPSLKAFVHRVILSAALVCLFCPPSTAEIALTQIDTSAAEEAGLGSWIDRINSLRFYAFDGVDSALINLGGTSWHLTEGALAPWPETFPVAGTLSEVVTLPDGRLIGGFTSNHMRFAFDPTSDRFVPLPDAQDLYWTDHVDGSGIVFARRDRDGALLQLEGDMFVASEIPQLGETERGEFLPWYSATLDAFITAWDGGLWFYAPGDPDWQVIEEVQPSRWSPGWGLGQRGSDEWLSPDGRLLRVISENGLILSQYEVVGGRPHRQLPRQFGGWTRIPSTGEVVGWLGHWSQRRFETDPITYFDERVPRFAIIAPNATEPAFVNEIMPMVLTQDDRTRSYYFRAQTHPVTGAVIVLHSTGFAAYRDGELTRLPEDWLTRVGQHPSFLSTRTRFFIGGSEGVFE